MLDYITSRYDQFIEDLETIVNIDSGSRYAPGVRKIAALFQQRFSKLSWYTQALSFADGNVPCLEATNVNPTDADVKYDFLFLGHMDMVFLEGTVQQRPFLIDGTQAKGPGVCDMKGGLVAMLHVMETLQHIGIADKVTKKSAPMHHGNGLKNWPLKASGYLSSSPAASEGSVSCSAKVPASMIFYVTAKPPMPALNPRRGPTRWSNWPTTLWMLPPSAMPNWEPP
jgi:hypothetical protein